ncbi:TIGR02922 family protein [Thalassotalea sp. PLHSN55]|uniref:TIGR02922 family protein n=1 Tax=Thalassotalea sp. PLHSN55 TaxID=3435888 RepID=UPI003F869493
MNTKVREVTVIYYHEASLELQHQIATFPENDQGRVVISSEFRQGKSIVAVCDGQVDILNKIGDRILSIDYVA